MESALVSDKNPLINGYEYTWGNIQLLIQGVPVYGVTAVNYSESQQMTNIYGAGRRPVARGLGNIEAEGSITLHTTEVKALERAANNQGIPKSDIKGLQPFDIIVSYIASEGQEAAVSTDILKNCQFTTNSRDMSQGDDQFEISLDIVCSHIIWNKP